MRNFKPVLNAHRPDFNSVFGQIPLSVHMSKAN